MSFPVDYKLLKGNDIDLFIFKDMSSLKSCACKSNVYHLMWFCTLAGGSCHAFPWAHSSSPIHLERLAELEVSSLICRSASRCHLSVGLSSSSSTWPPSSSWLDLLPYTLPQGNTARPLTDFPQKTHSITSTMLDWSKQVRRYPRHRWGEIDTTLW